MTTDADRLAADGIPLRVGDRTVGLRFTMRSMKVLEQSYGSLSGVNKVLQPLLAADEDGVPLAPCPYTTLLPLLAAGLLHEGLDEDALGDGLSPAQFAEARSALVDAINVSFPEPSGKAPEGDQDEPPPASPGASTSTSPPSATAELVSSSGT